MTWDYAEANPFSSAVVGLLSIGIARSSDALAVLSATAGGCGTS